MIARHRRLFWLLLIAIGVAPVLGMLGGCTVGPAEMNERERAISIACIELGGIPQLHRVSERRVQCWLPAGRQ